MPSRIKRTNRKRLIKNRTMKRLIKNRTKRKRLKRKRLIKNRTRKRRKNTMRGGDGPDDNRAAALLTKTGLDEVITKLRTGIKIAVGGTEMIKSITDDLALKNNPTARLAAAPSAQRDSYAELVLEARLEALRQLPDPQANSTTI